MKKIKATGYSLTVVTILLLVACGSGGGGGGDTTYTVTATAGANGSIAPASASVAAGSSTDFAITPNSGFVIDSVSGCGGSLSGNLYTTGTINADCTVTATFVMAPDTTAPAVSATSPVDGATNVARDSAITANFDEDLFSTTVDTDSFTLANTVLGAVPGNVSFDAASNVATLTPNNALAKLTAYTATLTTAITDLSGNALAADYNWSFTTADGSWGSAMLIELNNQGDGVNPQIAVASNGIAMVVWRQYDGIGTFDIWANRFDGTDWGTPELIENNNTGHAFAPQIAIDNNGNAMAVWHQGDGSGMNTNVWANRFDGTDWGTPELIESNDAGSAFNPQIAVDSNGNALAVWEQDDSAGITDIWVNRFAGASWGNATLIESGTWDAENPQIAVDANGNALAVWSQYVGVAGTSLNIQANRFVGASWGVAISISTGTGGSVFPQIAVDDSGNAMAVWRQTDDGITPSIWASRFDGTNWGMPTLIESNAGNAYVPQIAVDSNGNAMAVWEQFDGDRTNIWSNRFAGASWGSTTLIESDDAGNAENPQIAVDSNGNALAVWYQYDGTRFNIWANRFAGASWGNATLIESDAGDAQNPQIAVDSNGNAMAVWQQYSGARSNIQANRFE